ncbi:MAG TPA: ABC transporter permease, partial [Vicinamibacterales bacterium]|nr:ABC transporter permease [Vicinamibacterales bacterium]
MLNDLKYAVRNLRHAPGLAGVIVLTLALGIGANTAIFSVVKTLVFEPLPYQEADRLVAVVFDNDTATGFPNWVYPKVTALQQTATQFEAVAGFGTANVTVRVGDYPERVEAEIVSASYFPALRIAAARGRVFGLDEDRVPGERAVIVLSDRFWRRAFGADPDVVGRTLAIKDRAYEILGVMPAGFRGQSGTAELWIPAMMADHTYAPGSTTQMFSWWARVIARLAPGVSLEAAQAGMPGVTAKVAELAPAVTPDMRRRDGTELLKLVPLKAARVDPAVSRSFVLLLGAVGFVLLIACANTANLLLGRAVTRHREFAVRRAIGATGGQLARQAFVESLLLAVAAGCGGVLVAMWGLDWLTTAKPWNATGLFAQYARTFEYFDVALDRRALAFNFGLAALVGLVFGLAPAWHAARADVNAMLKDGAAGSAPGFRRSYSARAALVLTEIAFSCVLLVAGGLMARSFVTISSVDLGFDGDHLVTMRYSPTGTKPVGFYEEFLSRVTAMPGVERAALSLASPFGPGGW